MNESVNPSSLMLGIDDIPKDLHAFLAERRKAFHARTATVVRTRAVRTKSALFLTKNGKPTIARICEVVGADFGIESVAFYNKHHAGTNDPVTLPLKIICHIARDSCDCSLIKISQVLKCSRSSVNKRVTKMRLRIKNEPDLGCRVTRLKKELCL